MIEVTATIGGTASPPQWDSHWRRASEIGSNASRGGMAAVIVADGPEGSVHRRLAVVAPDRLERLHDLALTRVDGRAVDEDRHQVLVLDGRGGAQPRELRLDGRAVATGADGLQPAELLALERRVDAEDLRLARVALGEPVDADD